MGRDTGRPPLARRTGGFGTSIFTEMTALAVQHGAVNLGQGFPDFPAPDLVKEAGIRHIREDRNQYVASPGLPRLRQALADDWRRRNPGARAIDPAAEITVGSGATELLLDAFLAVIDPGDEVIVFEPAYDAYGPDIALAGGVPRVVPLRQPGWRFDPDELRAAVTPRTRAVVLNTPHNPTGKVFARDELEVIAALCRDRDLLVMSDEVYSELVLPARAGGDAGGQGDGAGGGGATHVSIATLPGMFERTITIDSMGKTFSVTGWKVGWAVAPAELTRGLRAVHQFVTFTHSAPFQEALADVLPAAAATGYYDTLRAAYARRRDSLAEALAAAGLSCQPIDGAYFLLADLAPLGVSDADAFCRQLVTEWGVAAIPMSAFYGNPAAAPPLARFCFAKRDETIAAAAERLRRLRGVDAARMNGRTARALT